MRWRVSYEGEQGFRYVVQPKRRSRQESRNRDDTSDIWPDPNESWGALRAWESRLSTQEARGAENIQFSTLAHNIQVPEEEVVSVRGTDTFRIKLTDFIDPNLPPGDAICQAFNRHISAEHTNPLSNAVCLETAIVAQTQRGQPQALTRDALSSLPQEILDLILESCLRPHLDIVAVVSSPGSPRPRSWGYTPSERVALRGIPKNDWAYVSALPLFNVSQLLRNRIVAVVRRRARGTGGGFSANAWPAGSSATLRLDGGTKSPQCHTEPLDVGVVPEGDQPPGLRTIPRLLWGLVTRLDIVVAWDFGRQSLLSPVKRLIGFESTFHFLAHISVRCQVIGLNSPELGSARDGIAAGKLWEDLANALYKPGGAYSQIAEEVGTAVNIATWAALTGRTGIWPGYCLRPACTPDEPRPCVARVPMMSQRMPIIDIELLPILGG